MPGPRERGRVPALGREPEPHRSGGGRYLGLARQQHRSSHRLVSRNLAARERRARPRRRGPGAGGTGSESWALPPGRITAPPAPGLGSTALTATVESFFAEATEGETLLFYFSGHGTTEGEEAYLLPIDFTPGELEKALSASALWKMIEKSPAARVLVILDACRAGGFAIPVTVKSALVYGKAAFLSATQPSATAASDPSGSPFTGALLAALRDPELVDGSVLAVTPDHALHAAALDPTVSRQSPSIDGALSFRKLPLGWPTFEGISQRELHRPRALDVNLGRAAVEATRRHGRGANVPGAPGGDPAPS